MPRPPLTPEQARAQFRTHVHAVRAALNTIEAIMDGDDSVDDASRVDLIVSEARAVEAAGCYFRRKADMVTPA